jgi:gustatory receptor
LPTISLTEIYSIYGGYIKKNCLTTPPKQAFVRNQDEIEREMKKLATKLENREDNLISRFRRRNVIEVEELKLSKLTNSDEIIDHLTKLLDIHDILLDCINLQNEILSFQILLVVAQIFIFKVFCLFGLYRTMYSSANSGTNALAMSNLFWFVIYCLILYVIISVSTDCMAEGKMTGTCVHKVINKIGHYADPKVVEKLSVMSHQLVMRTPDITCGLFTFDWELMFSIISAITIYLIFLIQFDVADNPNTPDTF